MVEFEVRIYNYTDDGERESTMFCEARDVEGVFDAFSDVMNLAVGHTARIELCYSGRVVMTFETIRESMKALYGGFEDAQ